MKTSSKLLDKLLLIGLCVLFLILWYILEFPCLVRYFTGLICPACGMTRAWLAAIQLNLAEAFSFHPMFWSVPVLVFYFIYDGHLFPNKKLNRIILGTLIAGLFVCYLIRLIVSLDGNITI